MSQAGAAGLGHRWQVFVIDYPQTACLMKKPFLIRSLYATVVAVLFTAVAALAQGPGSGGPTPTGGATQIPIDGGASLLLAAGGAYGLKRLRAYRAAKKQS